MTHDHEAPKGATPTEHPEARPTCEVCGEKIAAHTYHIVTEPGWGIHHECPEEPIP